MFGSGVYIILALVKAGFSGSIGVTDIGDTEESKDDPSTFGLDNCRLQVDCPRQAVTRAAKWTAATRYR